MRLSCIIVEDEPSGRKILEEFIVETDFLQLDGQASNPLKAMSLLSTKKPDLMFLDVQMPKINGIDFLRSLKDPPLVILTTAFPEYAVSGFELDVVDYLLKPISIERYRKAVRKARELYEYQNKELPNETTSYFFVKSNGKFEKILFEELLYVEAADNYVLFHLNNRRLISYITFRSIGEHLPTQQFIRVHKSFIVALNKINRLDGEEIIIGSHSIPISRNRKEEVLNRIVNRNLIRR